MKSTKILYWIFTILFAGMMIFSAIPNVMKTKEAMDFIGHLGYPPYFVPFIGVAKLAGSMAILIPGFPRIKEWAYAGLLFDLVAAYYSIIANGDPAGPASFILLVIALGIASYLFYHKLNKPAV